METIFLRVLQVGGRNCESRSREIQEPEFVSAYLEITARGTLTDGRSFQFQVREMGVEQQSVTRHIKIEFK